MFTSENYVNTITSRCAKEYASSLEIGVSESSAFLMQQSKGKKPNFSALKFVY